MVTGAGSATGIGYACAQALLELGAEVAITATGEHIHERVNALSEYGTVRSYVCDLTSMESTQGMFTSIGRDQGGIDILINNAGMASVGEPVGIESGALGSIAISDFNECRAAQSNDRGACNPMCLAVYAGDHVGANNLDIKCDGATHVHAW